MSVGSEFQRVHRAAASGAGAGRYLRAVTVCMVAARAGGLARLSIVTVPSELTSARRLPRGEGEGVDKAGLAGHGGDAGGVGRAGAR